MEHAKDIVLKEAIERFINERKCKRIGPNKHTLSIWCEHRTPEEVDETLLSVVMTNPYTGENFIYGDCSSEAYLFEEYYTIRDCIGDVSNIFKDLFDAHIEKIDDENEKITINGAGLLYEIIYSNLDIFDKYYEKHNNPYEDIPRWIRHKNCEWYSDIDENWQQILTRCNTDYYNSDTGVYTEEYSIETYTYAFDDETYGGFENTHANELIKTFAILLSELTNIRTEKTISVILGYNTKIYMEGYVPYVRRYEDNFEESFLKIFYKYVTNLEELNAVLWETVRHFNTCNIFNDETHGKFFTTLSDLKDFNELQYIFKYASNDFEKELLLASIYHLYVD